MFGAPSTSPFGAPAPAFGSPAPAFGAAPPATGGFGQPAATGGFGQPAAPATGAFGQPAAAPAFGAPAPAFGAPAPSAFGAPASGGFGQPAPATGGFGQPAPGGFGAPAPATGGLFGSAPAAAPFGSPAPAPAFGAKPSGGLFGAAAPAPATGGLFGSAPAPATGGLFGAAPTQAAPFGSPAPATPFGAPAAAPTAFGAPAPAFGAPAPSAFGAPVAGGYGQPQQTQTGSTVAPYQTTNKQDGNNSICLHSITAMPQYEQKSFEEIRLEDYLAGNKGTKGQAAPAASGFGGFGAAPAPTAAFGQPAPAPAFGAPVPAAGGLFGSAPAPAPTGGLFGAPSPAPAFGQPAPAPAFGAPVPAAGGLFGSAPAPAAPGGLFGAPSSSASAFGQPAPAPAFGAPAPTAGGLFGSPAPAPFGAPQQAPAFGTAPAPATGGLFGAPAPAPATGGLFGAPAPAMGGGLFGAPAPAAGGLFGAPAPAPAGGLFGAPTPAKPGGLFGATPAPAAGGIFGSPAPAVGGLYGHTPVAPASGGLFGASPAAPAVPMAPPPSAEAVLAQQLAAVENQKKQLELLEAWRGNPPSGSKVVPKSQYDTDSPNVLNGGGTSSYAASSSALLSYRAAPRSAAKIRPRGYTPSQPSSARSLGRKTGSPILTPNRFVGSATKTLFIKPNSLTPKPKTRLLLTNGVTNGNSPSATALSNVPTQELNGNTPRNGSQPTPNDSDSGTPRTADSPSTPAHDFYRHVVDDSTGRSPSASSPLQSDKRFVPKLTKPGYNVYPSITELSAMSEADLAAVSGFKVERSGYGSVEWDGAVDVRGVDIDAVVLIESKNVSVYDEAEEKGEKPERGSKLNRPAVITMHDIYPKDGAESSAEAKEKLKRKIEKSTKKMGAELLSFEADSGLWTFRVGHFSRYGLDDNDSDDEDSDEDDVKETPSLEATDDEQESMNQVDPKELGGAARMHAPLDEDESTVYTEMSATETLDQETEEEAHINEIVREGDDAYAMMMTEEVAVENYYDEAIIPIEPLADEIEEEEPLHFPNEAIHGITSPVRYSLKPTGPILHSSSGICKRLAAKIGMKNMSSSNINYGARMRGSFRVGWRPDGSFIQLKPSSSGAQLLVQSRPEIAPPTTSSSSIIPLVQTHQKHSVKVTESDDKAPIFTLPKSFGPGNELFDVLEDYTQSSTVCEKIVPSSFSLLMSLYCGDKTSDGTLDESRRVESVSNCLKRVVQSDTMHAISTAQSSGDLYGSVFAAMSGGDFASASSIALDSGNPRLSLMLANTGAVARPFCENQLQLWHKSGAQPFTPVGILRIFSLASGSIDTERQMYKSDSASYNIDWRRRFGMYLWSCSHSKTDDQVSVTSIMQQYGSDVSSGLAPPPTPMYSTSIETTHQCILYQVLNHYGDADIPLTDIVSPSSHTSFQHDFSSTFHLCASMTALTNSSLSLHQEDLIVDSHVSQLISEGAWEWAVYASLCFVGSETKVSESSASAKQLRAKAIISRFFNPSIDPSAERRRSFLQSIGIPYHFFEAANAYRASSEADVFRMVDCLMRFSRKDSMAALENIVIPHMILEGKESRKQLYDILESLKNRLISDDLECWNRFSGCGTIHNFIELHEQVDKLSNMSLAQIRSSDVNIDQLLDKTTELETTISKAADSFTKTPLTYTKIRYNFTRAPRAIVFAEVGMMLSMIRAKLLSIMNGQPISNLEYNQISSRCSYSSGDGLFAVPNEAIIRGFCGYKFNL